MRLISIQVSPHQLRKLKKGHKIRLRKGTGFNLVVHPGTYNIMSRAFQKSKGVDVKLSKEELEANQKVVEEPQRMQEIADVTKEETGELPNMEGKGIFDKIRKGLKIAAPILKPLAREGLKLAQPKLSEKLANKPMLQKLANKGMEEAGKRLGRGMPRGCGVRGRRSDSPPVHGLNRKIMHGVADDYGGTQALTSKSIQSRIKNQYPSYDELSQEPFAPFSRGYGMHHKHQNSIIGLGGGMVGCGHGAPYPYPPALVSQPYSANYQMAHFLPPAYQKYNNSMHEPSGSGMYAGNGLYAGRGYGLFT